MCMYTVLYIIIEPPSQEWLKTMITSWKENFIHNLHIEALKKNQALPAHIQILEEQQQ